MIMSSEPEARENKALAVAGYLADWPQTTTSLLMNSITENFRGVRNKTQHLEENFV